MGLGGGGLGFPPSDALAAFLRWGVFSSCHFALLPRRFPLFVPFLAVPCCFLLSLRGDNPSSRLPLLLQILSSIASDTIVYG